jgi:hypothetical protein
MSASEAKTVLENATVPTVFVGMLEDFGPVRYAETPPAHAAFAYAG